MGIKVRRLCLTVLGSIPNRGRKFHFLSMVNGQKCGKEFRQPKRIVSKMERRVENSVHTRFPQSIMKNARNIQQKTKKKAKTKNYINK